MATRNDLHEILLRYAPGLAASEHRAVLDACEAGGVTTGGAVIRAVADHTGMTELKTPLAAAAESLANTKILRHLEGMIRHVSAGTYSLQLDKPVDLPALNAAIRRGTPEDRIAIKSKLHELGCIA